AEHERAAVGEGGAPQAVVGGIDVVPEDSPVDLVGLLGPAPVAPACAVVPAAPDRLVVAPAAGVVAPDRPRLLPGQGGVGGAVGDPDEVGPALGERTGLRVKAAAVVAADQHQVDGVVGDRPGVAAVGQGGGRLLRAGAAAGRAEVDLDRLGVSLRVVVQV